MPILPFIAGALGGVVLTVLVMLLIRRGVQRAEIGRILADLIHQDQFEYLILDIRNPKDYSRSHISKAINLPFDSIRDNLPTEKMFEPLYVYGTSRRKAMAAARLLSAVGYFNVSCFGAFRGWSGPVESSAEESDTTAMEKPQ